MRTFAVIKYLDVIEDGVPVAVGQEAQLVHRLGHIDLVSLAGRDHQPGVTAHAPVHGAGQGLVGGGLRPDVIVTGKGLSGGVYPIAATLMTRELHSVFDRHPFAHISTFGGCTAGPAAALENMAIIEEENLLENTTAMGDYMLDQLHALADKHAVIGDVRGKGLFLGAELVEDRESRKPMAEGRVQKVVGDCMQQGIIIGATNRSLPGYNNTLCFSPALIATKDDIDQIISSVDEALTREFA